MTNTLMYSDRLENVPVQRGCRMDCDYCYARNGTWVRTAKCEKCKAFEPHTHLESLKKKPPRTEGGTFVTIGLGGDISFMDKADFLKVLEYCQRWKDTTFLMQSKNPEYFLQFPVFPINIILGTTLETNRNTTEISKAPIPAYRAEAMRKIRARFPNRRTVTVEPIMQADFGVFLRWVQEIAPWKVWIGYDNHKNNLSEPCLGEVSEFIEGLRKFTTVVEKTMRKPWNQNPECKGELK